MCYRHWWLVPANLRKAYWTAYRAWENGYGLLESRRGALQEAVDAVMRRSTA